MVKSNCERSSYEKKDVEVDTRELKYPKPFVFQRCTLANDTLTDTQKISSRRTGLRFTTIVFFFDRRLLTRREKEKSVANSNGWTKGEKEREKERKGAKVEWKTREEGENGQ